MAKGPLVVGLSSLAILIVAILIGLFLHSEHSDLGPMFIILAVGVVLLFIAVMWYIIERDNKIIAQTNATTDHSTTTATHTPAASHTPAATHTTTESTKTTESAATHTAEPTKTTTVEKTTSTNGTVQRPVKTINLIAPASH
jgi:cytoskeletal protein RodZ